MNGPLLALLVPSLKIPLSSSPAGVRLLAFPEATPLLPSGVLEEHGT